MQRIKIDFIIICCLIFNQCSKRYTTHEKSSLILDSMYLAFTNIFIFHEYGGILRHAKYTQTERKIIIKSFDREHRNVPKKMK